MRPRVGAIVSANCSGESWTSNGPLARSDIQVSIGAVGRANFILTGIGKPGNDESRRHPAMFDHSSHQFGARREAFPILIGEPFHLPNDAPQSARFGVTNRSAAKSRPAR